MAIRAITTLKNWFKTGCYPTEMQFGDLIDSFRHKSANIPAAEVDGLATQLNTMNGRIDTVTSNLATMQTTVENISTTPGGDGEDGAPGGFGTPTATVDNEVGTPSVEITASGPDTAKIFAFAFHNLKGAPGANGTNGTNGTNGESVVVTEHADNSVDDNIYKLNFTVNNTTVTTPNLMKAIADVDTVLQSIISTYTVTATENDS